MSYVTNILLVADSCEDDAVTVLRERFRRSGIPPMNELSMNLKADSMWGGDKNPEIWVLAGAYNYVDTETFMELIRGAPWKNPEYLSLIVWPEQQDPLHYRLVQRAWIGHRNG